MQFKNILLLLTAVGAASAFNGDATFFDPGLGACGGWNGGNDYIVALSVPQYGAAAGRGSRCGKRIRVHYKGKSVVAQVVDKCMGCAPNDIDLSPAAFQQLASSDLGRIKVSWNYI